MRAEVFTVRRQMFSQLLFCLVGYIPSLFPFFGTKPFGPEQQDREIFVSLLDFEEVCGIATTKLFELYPVLVSHILKVVQT